MMIQYGLSCVCLLSISIKLLRFIDVVAYSNWLFLLLRSIPLYGCITVYACSVDGHSGSFLFGSSGTNSISTRLLRADQIRSVAQSCPTLCDPINRSMPGLPVHHQLPEFTQTHVHRVSDAIQPSHPLSSPSPPASNPKERQCQRMLKLPHNCTHLRR